MALILPIARTLLADFLPKEAVCAEVGVFNGDFSQVLVEKTHPECLHLVDCWDQPADDPASQGISGEDRWKTVCERYGAEIEAGKVEVHRAPSVEAAAAFPDHHFDWIYLDADHSYEGVRADLEAWAPKLKPDGILWGHDYAQHDNAKRLNFGVVPAVNEFLKSTHRQLAALTMDNDPSWIAVPETPTQRTNDFVASLLLHVPCIEVRDLENRDFLHKIYDFGAGQGVRVVLSF